jgi:hypothetical protein
MYAFRIICECVLLVSAERRWFMAMEPPDTVLLKQIGSCYSNYCYLGSTWPYINSFPSQQLHEGRLFTEDYVYTPGVTAVSSGIPVSSVSSASSLCTQSVNSPTSSQ